jgi:biotin-(acetyl-CoA carboxylase) ligase
MKKTLLYLLAAAILGILVTVVPLITVAQIGIGINKQNEPQAKSLGQGLRQLEGGDGSKSSDVNNSDLAVLAISFVIALLAYTLVGHRAPRRYNMRLGVPPY